MEAPGRPASSATDATHSTSPTGRSSTGPSVRYCEWHSTNTVRTTLWPAPVSARSSLNVYGADDTPFDDAKQELATAFASYAAVAVANAGVYATTAQLAANLQRALDSRAVIDQAKGVLMGRHGISAEQAFDLLSKESQLANRKLRDIAEDLVSEVQRGNED